MYGRELKNKENSIRKEVSNKFSVFMLIFVLSVVLFHSGLRYHYPFIEDLAAIANSYFFCVSAFFFYRGLTKQNIYERWKKRTLLLPYMLWNLTYMILNMKYIQMDIGNIIKGFTVNNYCQPSWYLLTLFIFISCSFFIKEAFKNIYSTVIVLIVGITLSYCGYVLFQKELVSIPIIGGYLIRMSEYLTPYLIGGIIGTWFDKRIGTSIIINILGGVSSVLIVIILFANVTPGIRWLLWVVFPIVLWNAIPEKIFELLGFLKYITEPAFFISMLHCYFLNIGVGVGVKYWALTDKKGALFSVIFSVIVCYAVYYLLKIFFPKILNIYTGNRMKSKKSVLNQT